MPRFRCHLCGHVWDEPASGAWICENCTIASASYTILEYTRDEVGEIASVVRSMAPLVRGSMPEGSVFPAGFHESELDEATLDLLVLCFGHTLLFIDTFNLPAHNPRIREKLEAYVEVGIISLFSWDGAVNCLPGAGATVSFASVPEASKAIQKLAELQTSTELTFLSERTIAELFRQSGLVDVPHLGSGATSAYQWMARERLPGWLNRFTGFSILCEKLGVSLLTDRHLGSMRRVKHTAANNVLARRMEIALELEEWYGSTLHAIPSFRSPEKVLEFRSAVGPDGFIDDIVAQYQQARATALPALRRDVGREVRAVVARNLELARAINGPHFRTRSAVLSGLLATAGGMLGGTPGALLGGVGASVIAIAAEAADRSRVPHWATFIVDAEM